MEMMQTSPVILERVGGFPLGMENQEFQDEGWLDDGDTMSRNGRGNIRSHLNDLAQRHPEFANTLQGPAWGERMWMGDDEAAAAASGAQASSSSDPRQEQEQSDEPGPLRGRPRNNLPQHGLRNTVPDMGQRQAEELKEEARGQRSWSAPPDNRLPREPQRFVSRVNINPINPEDGGGDAKHQPPQAQASDNQGKPPPVPKPQQQQPQQSKPTSNVRHIPIFVEGRDEPILPKNVDADSEPASYQQFTSQAQHQFQPQSRPFPQQKRPFQTPQNNPPQQKQPNRSFNTSPKPFQQPNMNANFQQPQKQQQHQSQQENVPTDAQAKTAERPQPKVVNDPISKVQAIQKEIFALKEQVEKYSGNSRQEKDYVYLDEMLTRNLIKLDDIETDGKENIRQARKDAIRSIQQCINILEEKVPLAQEKNQPMEETELPIVEPESGTVESTPVTDEAPKEEEKVTEGSMETTLEEVVSRETPMDVAEKAESDPKTTEETIPNKES